MSCFFISFRALGAPPWCGLHKACLARAQPRSLAPARPVASMYQLRNNMRTRLQKIIYSMHDRACLLVPRELQHRDAPVRVLLSLS